MTDAAVTEFPLSSAAFLAWMRDIQQQMEVELGQLLPLASCQPQRLHGAMRYSLLGGGKRVRPLLVMAAGRLGHAPMPALVRAAAAVEMIHAYSLIHDDLPCMDDDVLRRGKPTCHVEYDEATALLAGDALQSQAFMVLADPAAGLTPARQVAMLKLLADASGAAGMCGGQAIDLASVGQQISVAELEYMHILKTGALIRASVLLGGHCAGVDEAGLQQLDSYARAIGLAFQVVDDILDATADTATLGKTAGKDAANDKPTYVTLLGLPEARRMADSLHQRALQALDSFGSEAEYLRALAHFIIKRSF